MMVCSLCSVTDSDFSQSCVVNDQDHPGRGESTGPPATLHHVDSHGGDGHCASQVS